MGRHVLYSAHFLRQEAKLLHRDRATRYINKFVLCFIRYGS